jgi:hypothetical protein
MMLAYLFACLTLVEAVKYGNNHVPVRRDSALVEANFPAPNVTLSSPAFLFPERVPPAFGNGSDGPTDDADMSEFEF